MICLGKLVNTHGLKGEVRIISDFKYKSVVFKKGSHLFIDGEELVINTYRVHKDYDMVTFDGITNIDDVLKYKGKKVYIKKEDFNFDGILNEDLIGLPVYGDGKKIGNVTDVYKNVNQELIEVEKDILIPYVPAFIKSISKEKIEINVIEGLLK
ncbi:MAG: 16S rRNA processing protein RimM [Bacilli bacterium]|nr:16S rRNA processing protein RimM [Bacilli bacterium]